MSSPKIFPVSKLPVPTCSCVCRGMLVCYASWCRRLPERRRKNVLLALRKQQQGLNKININIKKCKQYTGVKALLV